MTNATVDAINFSMKCILAVLVGLFVGTLLRIIFVDNKKNSSGNIQQNSNVVVNGNVVKTCINGCDPNKKGYDCNGNLSDKCK